MESPNKKYAIPLMGRNQNPNPLPNLHLCAACGEEFDLAQTGISINPDEAICDDCVDDGNFPE